MLQVNKFIKDERGNFIEQLLWMILFVLGLSPFIIGLTVAVGNKMEAFTDKISEVGE